MKSASLFLFELTQSAVRKEMHRITHGSEDFEEDPQEDRVSVFRRAIAALMKNQELRTQWILLASRKYEFLKREVEKACADLAETCGWGEQEPPMLQSFWKHLFDHFTIVSYVHPECYSGAYALSKTLGIFKDSWEDFLAVCSMNVGKPLSRDERSGPAPPKPKRKPEMKHPVQRPRTLRVNVPAGR